MIGYLSGTLIKKFSNNLLLEVNGVGYELFVTTHTMDKLPKIGKKANLFCHLIVREDAHTLYGFYEELERTLFKILIKVNGVGPKLAIGVLSCMSPQELISVVREKSIARLTSIPGVGKKTAERLLIELKDPFTKIIQEIDTLSSYNIAKDVTVLSDHAIMSEAMDALVTLGFKANEINKVMINIDKSGKSSQDIIKSALQLLAR